MTRDELIALAKSYTEPGCYTGNVVTLAQAFLDADVELQKWESWQATEAIAAERDAARAEVSSLRSEVERLKANTELAKDGLKTLLAAEKSAVAVARQRADHAEAELSVARAHWEAEFVRRGETLSKVEAELSALRAEKLKVGSGR